MYEIFLGINIFLLAFSFPHQAVTFVIRFPILHINQTEYHSVSAYTHAALHWPVWLSLKAILCAKTRSWKVLQDSGLILPADEASPLSNMPSVTATLLYPWWAYGQDVGLCLDKAGEERQEENLQGAGVEFCMIFNTLKFSRGLGSFETTVAHPANQSHHCPCLFHPQRISKHETEYDIVHLCRCSSWANEGRTKPALSPYNNMCRLDWMEGI